MLEKKPGIESILLNITSCGFYIKDAIRIQWDKMAKNSFIYLIRALLLIKSVNKLQLILFEIMSSILEVSFVILRIKQFKAKTIRYKKD